MEPSQIDYQKCLSRHISCNGGFNNFEVIEINRSPCNSNTEAKARARHNIMQLNASLKVDRPAEEIHERYCYSTNLLSKANETINLSYFIN